MTYDEWKTTNPADRWLGPDPDDFEDAEMYEPTDAADLVDWMFSAGFLGYFLLGADSALLVGWLCEFLTPMGLALMRIPP